MSTKAVKLQSELKMGAATRAAFGDALLELARQDERIVVCDADLSKSTMTHKFAQAFPHRFFSCGIAEANMVGVGAGLASAGKIAVVSSFSCFVANKGFEQLRVAVAYPQVKSFKVVGTHSGISIGEDGPSQMAVEDLSLACALPGFVVISPADEVSMKALFRAAVYHDGPVYVRAGRAPAPIVHSPDRAFELGKAVELVPGADVAIVATGLMVAEAIRAAEQLETEGVSARVLDMHTIKPLDREAIHRAAAQTGAVVVAEEHLVDSGLGVRVAQVVAETHPAVMEFVGIQDTYAESGTPAGLLEKYGLVASNVAAAARRALDRKKQG
ncbi:MAG: transketolase family protein [Bryobacteraceae bacterium]|nr:transketolase family protein [Bryobacteraceae bacterium]